MSENFDSNWSNPDFKEFGLNANSSVLNTSSFFISFILLIILHFLIISLKIFVDKWCSWGFWWCLMTLVKWVLDKCLIIMTYGYYIRFTMEMNQFLLVASIYEIYSLSLSTLFNIISFCCAFLVLFFCLLFTYIVLYLSFSSYEISDDKQNKMGEFFLGIKMDKKYKFFASALILRRTLFVILLITLMSISSKLLILIFGSNSLSNNYFIKIDRERN